MSVNNKHTEVVSCFIIKEGKLLLLKRSQKVGTYKGKWAVVSGRVEEMPLGQAYREIGEELGLEENKVKLLKKGLPIYFDDKELGRSWLIHPFLFGFIGGREPKLDWENEAYEWVSFDSIKSYDIVPKLEEAFKQVYGEYS